MDVGAIGGFYADWTKYGRGITDYLCVPDIPLDGRVKNLLPGGYHRRRQAGELQTDHQLQRQVLHRWRFRGDQAFLVQLQGGNDKSLHPYKGRNDAELHRFPGRRQIQLAEVADLHGKADAGRPLPRVMNMLAAWSREPTKSTRPLRSTWCPVAGYQGRRRGAAFDHRPPCGTGGRLRRAGR